MSRTYSAPPAELIRLRNLSSGSHVVVLVSNDTTMSICYAHVHWKKSPPNSSKLDRIRQVVYRIKEDGQEKRKGLIDVWADNIYAKTTGHWRWFPAVYTDHLKRIVYRLDLYLAILRQAALDRGIVKSAELNEMKLYIGYMDKVLDDIWEEARQADNKGLLTATWRSPSFDKWLVIEHVIGRHDTESIEKALTNWNESDSGRFFKGNPEELGKFSLFKHKPLQLYLIRITTHEDWVEYEQKMPEWHHGGPWDYKVDTFASGHRRDVLTKLCSWLMKESGTCRNCLYR